MVVGRLAEAGVPVPAAADPTGVPDGSGRGATAERVVVTVGIPFG
jgi:hypothetical protein